MTIDTAPPEPKLQLDQLSTARKRRDNTRMLWRLSGWGGSAAIALTALAAATQTQSGSQRLQLALASDNQTARPVAIAELARRAAEKDFETRALEVKVRTLASEKDAETRALQTQIRALAADRDRLNARIASLEQNLDNVTGSIKRQAAAAPPAAAPPPAPAVSAPPASTTGVASTTVAAAAPANAVAPPAPATPQAIPLPPTRLAAAPATEAPAPVPHKPEFGIDLGGAPNLEVLSARWAAVKANFGPLLTGLYPLAAHRPGATTYRLLVGPLPNTAAGAQLCARFAAARVTCRPVKFAGERLAQH